MSRGHFVRVDECIRREACRRAAIAEQQRTANFKQSLEPSCPPPPIARPQPPVWLSESKQQFLSNAPSYNDVPKHLSARRYLQLQL